MSIDRINVNNHGIDNHRSIDRGQEARNNDRARKGGRDGSSPSGDSVALSSTAKEVGRLSKLASEGADRASRIAEVRQAIDEGAYKVSGEDIANKMIQAHTKSG